MDKVVKLESVLNLLREKAQEAKEKADECAGVDNNADAYFRGLRDGYLQSAKLLKDNSDKPVRG